MPDSGHLTVVVGNHPAAGTIAAHLSADLGDGLAIAVRDFIGRESSAVMPARLAGDHLRLNSLPAASLYPDANLGVTGFVNPRNLADEINTLERLGHRTRHRLTVEPSTFVYREGSLENHPILRPAFEEIGPVADIVCPPGGLAIHARDSVLRAGGRVLVEALCGPSTILDALAFAGLAPWTPYIATLDMWVTVTPANSESVDTLAHRAADLVRRNGGPTDRLNVAVAGVDRLGRVSIDDVASAIARVADTEALLFGTESGDVVDRR